MGNLGSKPALVPLTSGDLGADIVTAAKIGDDVLNSEHYAAGSIDEEHVADNAITLAKMASGTDGNIISFDASGNPVAIATGNDGQVLTSAGAGAPPAFEAAGGGKVVKCSMFQTATYSTGTFSACGLDDTIPTVSEMHICMELSYSPTDATNELLITAFFMGSVSSDGNSVYGLFKDSDADAIASWRDTEGDSAANKLGTHLVYFKETAGSTSARTYKVGLGGTTGATAYFLGGQSSGRKLGGVSYGNIIIYEIDEG